MDKSAVEYCTRLTEFYAQFRAVAVNYNQVVKALHSNFSEKTSNTKEEANRNVMLNAASANGPTA